MSKIVFLGDSVTKGTDYGGVTSAKTFASLIGIANGYASADIINAGVGGNNSAQALARLDADVIAHAPDVCVVMLGNNDCQGSNSLSAAELEANMRQIISALRAAGIKPVIMSMALDRGDSAKFAAYMPYLRATDWVAADTKTEYVDVYREFAIASLYLDVSTWSSMFVDSLHLAAPGHQYVADFASRNRFAGVFVADDAPAPPAGSNEPLACAIADYILLGANADRIAEISTLRGEV